MYPLLVHLLVHTNTHVNKRAHVIFAFVRCARLRCPPTVFAVTRAHEKVSYCYRRDKREQSVPVNRITAPSYDSAMTTKIMTMIAVVIIIIVILTTTTNGTRARSEDCLLCSRFSRDTIANPGKGKRAAYLSDTVSRCVQTFQSSRGARSTSTLQLKTHFVPSVVFAEN